MPHEKRFGSVSIAGVATLLSMSEILGVLDEDLIRETIGRFEEDKHPPFGQFAHARANSDLKVHIHRTESDHGETSMPAFFSWSCSFMNRFCCVGDACGMK